MNLHLEDNSLGISVRWLEIIEIPFTCIEGVCNAVRCIFWRDGLHSYKWENFLASLPNLKADDVLST